MILINEEVMNINDMIILMILMIVMILMVINENESING